MRIPSSFKCASCFLSTVFLLFLIIAGARIVYPQSATCPELTNDVVFEQGTTVYIDIGAEIRGTTIGSQIIAGLNSWTYANTHYNNSGVKFDTTTSPWNSPPGSTIVHFVYQPIYDQFGNVDPYTVARLLPVRVEGIVLREATVIFNSAALANPYDPNSGPYYNPNLLGYDSVFAKKTRHEIGHGMGLDHPIFPVDRRSVMNPPTIDCPNDNCDGQPDDITPCDNEVVNQVLQYFPPPPPPPQGTCNPNEINDCYASGGSYYDDTQCLCRYEGCSPSQQQACENVGAACMGYGTCYTPLLIDTSGNGFRLTDPEHGVDFDIAAIGTTYRISWTEAGSDDAWLVLDRNGNGQVDDGTELFGDKTPQPVSDIPNGFVALAEYDKPEWGGNSDGMIDNRDTIYSSLRLWQDRNHNGISEAGELHSLASLNVEAIWLDYKEAKRRDRHGNWYRYRAKVDEAKKVKKSKKVQVGRWAWDVWLRTAP